MPVDDSFPTTSHSGPLLSDMMTIESSVSIFYSYARETRFSRLLEGEDSRLTILAPTNKAVMALARKPHQGPESVEEGITITEEEFERNSRDNVEKWIGAHIIPQYPIKLLPSSQFETMLMGCVVTLSAKDSGVSFEENDSSWSNVLINGNISIAKKISAGNGDLYIIDGAIYG
ncbi:hypothetical protein SCHPADRAFT_876503 [Schizopora paradoxa]|uniref:FAS1 domain-containing protein n=1 Tax=Schizopora paradoxa TaxID=27342 RepID=A0A0H2RIB3_9AGAM|nr:hypothetical protein SCHPADRAFT_876503 [Schizopora paradoxa]